MPDDLTLLTGAARAAGEIAKEYFQRDPKVWDKPDAQGPVTEADLAVNAHLREALRRARPGYGWLSEEDEDGDERLTTETLFIVDPLDGTRAFIAGEPTWAVSIAVVTAGTPVAAAVYLPIHDRLFAAAKGEGATLNGAPIGVAARDDLNGATLLAARHMLQPVHWRDGHVPEFVHKFRSSLAYRLSLIGQGRYDAMMTLRPTWEWDVAAGTLIVTEAGGRVTDRQGKALRFNNALPQLDGVLAANPSLQGALVDRLL